MPRTPDVKAIRTKLGISQKQLSQHIWGDTSKHRQRSIARWENGHNAPSPIVVQHLKRLEADHEAKRKAAGDTSMPTIGKRKIATPPASDTTEMPTRGPSRAHTALPGLS